MSGQGDNNQYCEVDSTAFKINALAAEPIGHIDQAQLDTALEQIHKSGNSAHENDDNWDSALNEVTDLTKEDDKSTDHTNAASTESSSSDVTFKDYIDVNNNIHIPEHPINILIEHGSRL